MEYTGNLPGQQNFLWALKTSDIDINNEWKERRFSKITSPTIEEISSDKKHKLSNFDNVLEQTRILASLVPDEILEKVDDYTIRHYDAVFLFGDVSDKSVDSVSSSGPSTNDSSTISSIKPPDNERFSNQLEESESNLFDITKILKLSNNPLDKYRERLVFREHLVISNYQPQTGLLALSSTSANQLICAPDLKTAGGIVIDAQIVGPNHDDFLVFVSSQLTYKHRNGGSHITSCILPNFHTVEEKRIEFIKVAINLVEEKHMYSALQDTGYYVVTRSKLQTTLSKTFYTFDKTENLILEGANFLLMRYLALIKYIGTFEMVTLYINGDLCRNIYSSDGPEAAIINNAKCDTIKIQRIVQEKCGIIHYCITTLLLTGHIVKQEWQDCSFVLHLNPLVDMDKEVWGNEYKVPVFYEWEKDMQLFSRYLDFKTKRLALHKNYYEDHPELKDLISDYCQSLLLQKPEDILDFTIQYFRRFNKDIIPFGTYFTKGNNE